MPSILCSLERVLESFDATSGRYELYEKGKVTSLVALRHG